MSPSEGEYDYIAGGVFTHPRPEAAVTGFTLVLDSDPVTYKTLKTGTQISDQRHIDKTP